MAALTHELAAQAREAVLAVQREGRERYAARPPRTGLADGYLAALDLPAEVLQQDVADGIASGLRPREAAIRALDAWIKSRRQAINRAARASAAEHLAERLHAAAEAVRRGDSVQDWTAQEPFVQAGGVSLSVLHRGGGAVEVARVDGEPVHSLCEPAERAALAALSAAVSALYRQATDLACSAFRPTGRSGTPGAVSLHDHRGRLARGYVDDAGALRIYEVDGLPVSPDAPAVQAIALQAATARPSAPPPIP